MKVKSESEVAQSRLTLCNPMDCSLPGSSVLGIFQARVLAWVAIAFSVKAYLFITTVMLFFFNFKDKLKSSFWNDNYEPVLEMSYIWRSIKDVFYNQFSINNNTFLRNLKIRLLSIENWCFSPIVSTSESIWKVGQRQQPCACVWFWFHLHSCPDSCGLDPFQILCLTVACMKIRFPDSRHSPDWQTDLDMKTVTWL